MNDSRSDENNLALFIDFDNIALGLKPGPKKKFEVRLVMERLLEKGKIIIKKAYADWSRYPEYKNELHGAGIEMMEIPKRKISGKNSADIRLAVDAMDLCYSKEHLDTFVIVSGDSDFSPLVSKLRENNKSVIGLGMRDSSSQLLIDNCDEFIFYEDLAQAAAPSMGSLPTKKASVSPRRNSAAKTMSRARPSRRDKSVPAATIAARTASQPRSEAPRCAAGGSVPTPLSAPSRALVFTIVAVLGEASLPVQVTVVGVRDFAVRWPTGNEEDIVTGRGP